MAVDYEEGRRLLAAWKSSGESLDEEMLLEDWMRAHAEALLNPDPWRPIEEAPKDRTPILAKFNPRVFPDIRPSRPDLECWNGVTLVLHHPGLADDGFDIGWSVSAPVGHGGFPDDWIVGWMPVPHFRELKGPGQ